MRLEAGVLVAARYEIDTTIGVGGMSVVYRAYDMKLDRYVTLKVLKEDYLADDDLADRFPQEARAAAALNHQNIVSIFDFGQDGDICYIVLEYVDGATLKELITKKAPFADDIILAVTIQIAQGLAEAHRNGIVHRDIKPQNTLITRSNIVKVTDFGIARVAKTSTLTAGAGSMGSVHYSSPEQARNGYLDHTTDIYSLGVCMYEMATGRLPFDGEMEVSVAMCHLNNEFPDILDFNPNVSQSIIKIIAKATEKSSSLRYQTAEDLIIDLKRAQTDDSGDFVTEEVVDTSIVDDIAADPNKLAKEQRENARKAFLDDEEYEDDYDDYDDNSRSDKAAVWGGIVLAFVFMAIVTVLGILYVLPRFQQEGSSNVIVPNVVGMPLAQAQATAEGVGLGIIVFDHDYSDDFPENYVIAQVQSTRFTGLTIGDQIQVTLSLGAQNPYIYTMPDLLESNLADAQTQLALLSVNVRIERQTEEYIEIDTIISQTPDAGTLMREGAEIVLRVSAGPDTGQVHVPLLIGQTETSALELLSAAMLIPGNRTVQESTTYAQGVIMMQSPMPDELVYRETTVNYTVSSGPPAEEEPATQEESPAEEDPSAEEEPPTVEDPPAEDEQTAQEDPPAVQVRTRLLTIEPWIVPEGTETVHIIITRQIGDAAPTEEFNDPNVAVNTLPRQVQVTGTGTAIYRIWSVEDGGMVETLRGFFPINFDEE